MLVKDFFYHLPPRLIAQTPPPERDGARLLLMNKNTGRVRHRQFCDIINYLTDKDLLVFNDTRVIPARLYGRKDTGAKIEVFLLRPRADNEWEVLVKPGRKAGVGTVIDFAGQMSCRIVDKTPSGGRVARFFFTGDFTGLINRLGETPLPPYIREKLSDPGRYQTVYAKVDGSAAAPTAGLHFTEELLAGMANKGIQTAFITLHIGLGTFRPVNSELVEDHIMHSEYYAVDKQTAALINKTKTQGGRVIAVGTTAVRVLESRGQTGVMQEGGGQTDIFIYPGYTFRMTDALITNFHLPQSTLLMLVSAFSRREFILSAYQEAINERYRFFSFGDAMFLY